MAKLVSYLDEELLEKIKKLADKKTHGNISKITAELLKIGIETMESGEFSELYKKMVLVQLQTLEFSKKILKCVNDVNLSGFENTDDFSAVASKKSRDLAKELLEDSDRYF